MCDGQEYPGEELLQDKNGLPEEKLIPAIVMDASALLALVLSEEEGPGTENILVGIIEKNGQIFVPPLFWYEVMNALVVALRRKRIRDEDLRDIEVNLSGLPVATDPIPPSFVRQRIREYAEKHDLSFYDASYLELALRNHLPLLTLDSHLLGLKRLYPDLFY